ncbi:DEAD/DEAH box helicase [Parabacteroides sp. FAFU027]|uniref:DEAD/DEAH box helicase n=1 Tax=Parabacteroides sp. FAFU027 TaxID=2922715 RepID=UPI001FAF0CFC|nr:AAA domain-containing protein [Parabacteroides sp. FAFU027]
MIHHFSPQEYYAELLTLHVSDRKPGDKLMRLRQLFDRFCRQATHEDKLSFANFFSRLDFVVKKYGISPSLNQGLNALRIRTNPSHRDQKTTVSEVEWAIKLLADLIYEVSNEPTPVALFDIYPTGKINFSLKSRFKGERIPKIRCHFSQATGEDSFLAWTDDDPDEPMKVQLSPDFDESVHFAALLEKIHHGASLNLVDVAFDEENHAYLPEMVVLEPDYLMDISALAECFKDYGKHPLNYIYSRLELPANNKYLLLGNVANAFLDAFVNAGEGETVEYGALMKEIFNRNPFDFTTCPDIEQMDAEKQFFADCKLQFDNISKLVNEYFPQKSYGIDKSQVVLEPGFLCETLGFQGRLDLMMQDYSCFIELKSGKAKEFPPPLSHRENHYVQMMLYFAILHYNMGVDVHKSQAYLMYSKYPMLYPERPFWSLVKTAVEVRNRIVLCDYGVQHQNEIDYTRSFLATLNATTLNEKNMSGKFWETYLQPDIDKFEKRLKNLTQLESDYFHRLYNFITKEQFVSKTGSGSDYDANRGIFTLWNASLQEKIESGEILHDLTLEKSEIRNDIHRLRLSIPAYEGDFLPNFRAGDIVLIYERNNAQDNVCNRQVIKASIIAMDNSSVELQLRCPQKNASVLPLNSKYAIEHDYMDVGFTAMYKSLAAFLKAKGERRDLLLGQREAETDQSVLDKLTGEESDFERVALKAKAAKDYFLLLGPPGTGKTSCALRQMVETFYAEPDKNILLMAYTNKAVDEICRALECIEPSIDYIRVGNAWSSEVEFHPRLLENQLAECRNRAEVRQRLQNCRVYVSTVPTMNGRTGLFRLKRFDVAIVDEASQIIEPQLLWLLCAKDRHGENAIGKFVLIGDHKQLPAVVVQSPSESEVKEESLRQIGLLNFREALFERLFRNATEKGLTHCIDMLHRQGRMHEEVAEFANKAFYHNRLRVVPTPHQEEDLPYEQKGEDSFTQLLASKRIHFFPTTTSSSDISFKINSNEAKLTAEICRSVYDLYKLNDIPFHGGESVGIITPYRSQIAAIRRELQNTGITELQGLSVDTVERFQGGQRDVIIYSFCVNRLHQLAFLPNITIDEGVEVDRKLNVALTRAKKQLFILGNPEILEKNPIYKRLLDWLG